MLAHLAPSTSGIHSSLQAVLGIVRVPDGHMLFS